MVSLTCVSKGSMVTAEGPRPEKLILKAWGLVGCILEEFPFLRPCNDVIESYGTFGSFPRWCLLQGKQIANLYRGWLAPDLDVIQGPQRTEDSVPVSLQLKRGNIDVI